MYNYLKAVKNDVLEAMQEKEMLDKLHYCSDRQEYEDWLNETLWYWDSVTGLGSGSYTFNTYDAEENLCHNLDLLLEASEEMGGGLSLLKDGAETCDVCIRCYLLPQAISEVIEENFAEYFEED